MYPTVELRVAAADRVRRGHPWVFRDGLARGLRVAAGDAVTLVDQSGQPLATGLADPGSDLAVRVFGDGHVRIDQAFFAARLEAALRLRAGLGIPSEATAWRWVHGENDGLPGFVVDIYDHFAVVKLDAPYERYLDAFVAALLQTHPVEGVLLREKPPRVLHGLVPDRVTIRENGFSQTVEPLLGQKTGMFIDQRENRRWVRDRAAGQTVLNLFSYTGGFSLAALQGGARHVTSVDIAAPALATLDADVAANAFTPGAHASVAADCYDFLRKSAEQGRTWSLVILDPPSLAHSKAAMGKARAAYERLNTAAMRVLEPGGLFCTASCTSRITPEDFRAIVAHAAEKAERRLQIIHEAGAGADHPVLLSFPEGRYLKFMAMVG